MDPAVPSEVGPILGCASHLASSLYIYIYTWRFAKIGVPLNHPFYRTFLYKPSIYGNHHLWNPPYISYHIYHIISYHIRSYHILSYHIISYIYIYYIITLYNPYNPMFDYCGFSHTFFAARRSCCGSIRASKDSGAARWRFSAEIGELDSAIGSTIYNR